MLQDQNFYNKPVRSLQTMLRSLAHTDENYRNVIPDGVYGPETHSAVSTFQRNHALPVTGIVNHETWEHIVAASSIQTPPGPSSRILPWARFFARATGIPMSF